MPFLAVLSLCLLAALLAAWPKNKLPTLSKEIKKASPLLEPKKNTLAEKSTSDQRKIAKTDEVMASTHSEPVAKLAGLEISEAEHIAEIRQSTNPYQELEDSLLLKQLRNTRNSWQEEDILQRREKLLRTYLSTVETLEITSTQTPPQADLAASELDNPYTELRENLDEEFLQQTELGVEDVDLEQALKEEKASRLEEYLAASEL